MQPEITLAFISVDDGLDTEVWVRVSSVLVSPSTDDDTFAE